MKKRQVIAMAMAGAMLLAAGLPASASEEELMAVSEEKGFPLEEPVTISAFIEQLSGVVELSECCTTGTGRKDEHQTGSDDRTDRWS